MGPSTSSPLVAVACTFILAGLALAPSAKAGLLVSSFYEGKVYLLDENSGAILRTYADPSLRNSTGLILSPDGNTLYVGNGNTSVDVVAFNARTGAFLRTYANGDLFNTGGLAVSNDGGTLYASSLTGLFGFDTTSGTSSRLVNIGPFDIELSNDGSTIYGGTASAGNSVVKINPSDESYSVFTFPDYSSPFGVALSPDNTILYAALVNSGRSDQLLVESINPETGVRINTFVLDGPDGELTGLDISPDGSMLYVSDSYNDVLYKLDTATGVSSRLFTPAALDSPSYVLYTTIPEPGSLAFLGLAAVGLMTRRR